MCNIGYIKLHRKIVDWEWYDDINTKVLFIHILLMANYEDKRWHGELVKRGSFITSYQTLATQTGLSVQQVRTSIKKLLSTNDITKVISNKNTVIIVPNYDLYQSEQQASEQDNNKVPTNEQQTTNNQVNTQLTTTKKEKNIKNNKNIKENITKEKKETYVSLISDYTSNELLVSALKDFVEMRKNMKGFTIRAMQLALSSLDKIAVDDDTKIAIVNQSIENSWKSFYPLKDKTLKQKGETGNNWSFLDV